MISVGSAWSYFFLPILYLSSIVLAINFILAATLENLKKPGFLVQFNCAAKRRSEERDLVLGVEGLSRVMSSACERVGHRITAVESTRITRF